MVPAELALAQATPEAMPFTDNADSVAVVIGNRSYKQTVPVDYAHNDAEAIRAYLIERLGYRESNVFILKDATLNEFNQAFGTERNPQSGRLWRSVREGRSNVFVYYSGHGVPDLTTRQPFLLPEDGNPNQGESGYSLETLYRNLDLVKRKIGPERQLVVMVDACFTGETGRKGESLLAVSAPGFAPARPKAESGIVRLVATSGATPANWDETNKLGLLTSRFLMGVSGLADAKDGAGNGDGLIQWPELKGYLRREVEEAARRVSGREQVPEIDDAPIVVKASLPVTAVAGGVAAIRDEAAWRRAENLGTREAFEAYVGTCGEACAYRSQAMDRLLAGRKRDAAAIDQENWAKFGAQRQYQAYLDSCGETCAYRSLAEGYLGGANPSTDPRVKRCDALAAGTDDPDRPKGVPGVKLGRVEASAAIEACRGAAASYPQLRRLSYQLGRAYDRADRSKDAFAAYDRAAKAGSVSAMNNLAALYENGQGVKRGQAEAFRLYRQAGEGGNVVALANAARMLEYGNGIPKSEAEAVALYKRAVAGGDGPSISKLVPHYATGAYGFPRDLRQGFDLFRQAADKGDPVAMATMATLIDNGFGRYFPGVRSTDMVLRALKPGAEREDLADFLRLEPFHRTRPLTALRAASFGRVQSGIANRLRRGGGGAEVAERATCAEAKSYAALQERAGALAAHLARMLRIAAALRIAERDGLTPEVRAALEAAEADLRRVRRAGFEDRAALTAGFAATQAALLRLTEEAGRLERALAALARQRPLDAAFAADRSVFAAAFAAAYAEEAAA